jgi:hypothetical protein
MRIKIFKKKLIWFTEKDYKKILARFNYKKYKKDSDGNICSSIPCPLCEKYIMTCELCQLYKFKKEHNKPWIHSCPCENLITDILKGKSTEFYIQSDEIGYCDDDSAKSSIKQLEKIFNFLKSFDKKPGWYWRLTREN